MTPKIPQIPTTPLPARGPRIRSPPPSLTVAPSSSDGLPVPPPTQLPQLAPPMGDMVGVLPASGRQITHPPTHCRRSRIQISIILFRTHSLSLSAHSLFRCAEIPLIPGYLIGDGIYTQLRVRERGLFIMGEEVRELRAQSGCDFLPIRRPLMGFRPCAIFLDPSAKYYGCP